jgi:translation initiation factor 2 beta subunit (eIF-2beta)/eIF-5
MTAPNPLAARRRTNSSSFSGAVPSSWDESVVSGAIANRFAISRPQLNLKGDQTTIDRTSNIPQAVQQRMEAR